MSKLHRSTTDKWIRGVCGGLAETYSWNPMVVRLIYIILLLVLGIIPLVVVYIIASLIIKEG